MKNKIITAVLSLFFLSLSGIAFANDNIPNNYPHNPSATDDDVVGASIDQTAIWLMITAILVAFYIFINKKQAEKA